MATDHADVLAEHIDTAENAAEHGHGATGGLEGWALAVHKLDIAFVHALAGAETAAHEAVAAARAELDRFPASTFDHLQRDLSLMVARVHAALHGHAKADVKPSSKAAAKTKTGENQ